MKLLILIFGLSLVLFQNCSSPVAFDEKIQGASGTVEDSDTDSESVGGSTGTDDLDPLQGEGETVVAGPGYETEVQPSMPLEDITTNCENGMRIEKKVTLEFPKPQLTCDWGKNGNLYPLNRYFQARIEQKRQLNLPAGAIICDAKFDFVEQDFLYDDHFLLLFNENVIASSYDFSDQLDQQSSGLLKYDWMKLAGMSWKHSQETIFCPQVSGGQATCDFPGHDQQGFIELTYSPSYIQNIMSDGIPENHSFTMVSVGDNDLLDCEHSDVEFDVTVHYVMGNNSQ